MSVTILTGDAETMLRTLPDQSVQCVVTSPPYFALRDYGTASWEGGDAECDHIPTVRPRHERPNLGGSRIGRGGPYNDAQDLGTSTYRSECGKCGATRIDNQIGLESTLAEYLDRLVSVFREVRRVLANDGCLWLNMGDSYANDTKWGGSSGGKHVIALHGKTGIGRQKVTTGLKPKDLMMVPARLALALQADGWYLRSDIIWAKKAPMPESCRDRPTSAHEHIFLFAKQPRYYYDQDAVREPYAESSIQRLSQKTFDTQTGGDKDYAVTGQNGSRSARKAINNLHEKLIRQEKWKTRQEGWEARDKTIGANMRNVWHLGPEPFAEAHFATFVTEIPRRCILAGSRPGDTILDPFAGAGTTGLVADRLGRNAILIELNPAYVEMSRKRIYDDAPMFAEVVSS